MKRGRILFGGLCVVLSIGIIIESYRLRLGTLKGPGAGLWPFAVGLLFLCFSLAYLVKVLKSHPSGAPAFWGGVKWKKSLLAMLILLLYPVLLETMGFILTTSLAMAVLFRVDKPHRWVFTLSGAVLSSLGMYAIFGLWLKVSLPRGPWGF